MERLAIPLLLITAALWGCATPDSPAVLPRTALQEQDAAYLRLITVIGRYCSLSHNSFEASQSCVLEKLTALHAEEARKALSVSDLPTTPTFSLSVDQVANVSCARTRIGTACQRVPPPVTQTDLN
jgi:hypothetical protein